MGKYRCDVSERQSDDSVIWSAKWLGGPTIAKVENCRIDSLSGNWRVNAHVSGDADTYFSIPAYCYIKGIKVRGYLTTDENGLIVFHCVYY
jgi:hypothetical protein